MPSLTVNAITPNGVSEDGSHATLTLTTKYAGDLDVTMPASCIDDLIASLKLAKSSIAHKDPRNANQLKVTMPKTWLVTSDVKERGVVIVVFDHQSEAKAGYALSPDAAKKMAAGLTQSAEAILGQQKTSAGEEPGG